MKSVLATETPSDLLHKSQNGRLSASTGVDRNTERAHLDELLARVPEAIVLVDADGKIQRINAAFTRIFGYRQEETLGQSLESLIEWDDPLDEIETNMSAAIARGEVATLETICRRKDGAGIPVSFGKVPLPSAGPANSWYGIYRDLTERKRLEDELKCERDRLRLLLDITNSMASKLDLRRLVEVLSRSLLSVTRCDFCALLLPDEDRKELRVTVLYNPESRGAIRDGATMPLRGSLCGRAFLTGRVQHFNSLEELRDPEGLGNDVGRCFYERVKAEGLRSGCDLPLIGRNGVLGVLGALKRSEKGFEREDVEFLEQVSRQVAIAVENALDYERAIRDRDTETKQRRYLEDEIRSEFTDIVGESPALRAALNLVSVVAPTDSSVLIQGETGTGKELLARAIHDLSRRRERAFIKLNCAAIPLGLLESELFGHEKGAFTGAIAQKPGRFELANKGTLFLDEVGDIPLELQAKLLRVLQEHEFERLGSNRTHKVDVRLIAATHRDLTAMIKQGTFREDLYYRLRVFPVNVPALRQRTEDIPTLVWHFTTLYARRMNKRIDEIPPETMDALVRYSWPGNVRELQNFIERAVILSPHSVLRAPISELEPFHSNNGSGVSITRLAEVERDHILHALEASGWVIGGRNGAAERLGMKRTSLVYRMKKHRITRPPAQGDD